MAKTNYIKNTTLFLLYLLVLTGCNKTRLGMQADNGHEKRLGTSSSITCSENKKAKLYSTEVQELIDEIRDVSNGYLYLAIPNDISEEELKEVLAALRCNKSIECLALPASHLSAEKLKVVFATLCANPSIYKLGFGGDNFGRLDASTLGSLLSMLKDTKVEELCLACSFKTASFLDNLFNAQDFAFVLSSLRDTKIHTLDLRGNSLGSLGADLKNALSMLSNRVHTLYLDTNFVYTDIRVLGLILSGLEKTKIHTLSLAGNDLDDRDFIDVGIAFSEIVKSEVHFLGLEGNGFRPRHVYRHTFDDFRSILWNFKNSKVYAVSIREKFPFRVSDPVLMQSLANDFRAHIALPNYLKHGEGLKGLCIETIQKHIASIDKVDALPIIPPHVKKQIKNTYEGQIGLLYEGTSWKRKNTRPPF